MMRSGMPPWTSVSVPRLPTAKNVHDLLAGGSVATSGKETRSAHVRCANAWRIKDELEWAVPFGSALELAAHANRGPSVPGKRAQFNKP